MPEAGPGAGPDPDGGLDPEDAKLVALARSSRARAGTSEGAAVRDPTGRTYTAAAVELASLRLSALRAAVVLAAASGVSELAAAALVRDDGGGPVPADDLATVRDLAGVGAPVLLAGPDGVVRSTVRT
jgi:hypothetical protein